MQQRAANDSGLADLSPPTESPQRRKPAPSDADIDKAVDDALANGSVIYFIRIDQFVKIGVTRNIRKRWSELQTGSPHHMVLLGSIPGDALIEALLHKRWAKHAVRGEWFTLHDDIRKFVKKHVIGKEYVRE